MSVPFVCRSDAPRLHFHPVGINSYGLFKYPDYTLPLSVKMAEVSSRSSTGRPPRPLRRPACHGGDPGTLDASAGAPPQGGHDPARHRHNPAGPRRRLRARDTPRTHRFGCRHRRVRLPSAARPRNCWGSPGTIDVIHNFFAPRRPRRTREEMRRELGVGDEVMILHSSNLRPLKRIDLLLEAAARIRPRDAFKLVMLAGEDFAPFSSDVHRLGLEGRVIVVERVHDIEDYLQAADLGLVSSETESFCLSILEAMCFACPSVATEVGGIPEVIENEVTGILVPFGDPAALARAVEGLIKDPARRVAMGRAAQRHAQERFSADVIVPQYEALYRRICK